MPRAPCVSLPSAGAGAGSDGRSCCSPLPACSRSPSARACARRCSTCCSARRRSSTTARQTPPPNPLRRSPPPRAPRPADPPDALKQMTAALETAEVDTFTVAVNAGASTTPSGARSLSGEKAQRIVEAMRRSVARRGTAGSTFDRVSREAGVSRGLLHYYFGTKEQLLVEAVRRDCELRMEMLERRLAGARSAEQFIDLMVAHLHQMVDEDPDFITLLFALFSLSRRNSEVAVEYAELMRRTREQVAGMLATAEQEGILRLHARPDVIAEVLFSLGDGLA